MSPRPLQPWPAPTPAPPTPSSSSSSKRKRRRISDVERPTRVARQEADPAEVSSALVQCANQGNDVFSCFPDSQTVVPQHEYCAFVWNSRLPYWQYTDSVDVYLFHADTNQAVASMLNQASSWERSGSVSLQVDDTWFGDRGRSWNGNNLSYPFYWAVVSRGAEPVSLPYIPATFTAVQTTYLDVVASSLSSASSASAASASSASAASSRSAASATAASATATSGSGSPGAGGSGTNDPSGTSGAGGPRSSGGGGGGDGGNGGGNVQASGGGSFPHGAIAAIVVLGFLAIVAGGILFFLIMRRMRARRRAEANRTSIGSESPMMANVGGTGGPQSPLLTESAFAGAAAGAAAGAGATGGTQAASSSTHHDQAPSVAPDDGASTISRAHSTGEAVPFSGADAAIMADAFRKALRKPDFASRPVEEGESPEANNNSGNSELLNRELAEEGRDIRSVSSSRGVRVETLSDAGDTAQDNPH